MKRYLSFGGGVNSTALLLLLVDEGVEFEAVFVDHGTDWPETYEHVQLMQERGYPITVLRPDFRGFDNLYEYALHANLVPSLHVRWCTSNFKASVLYDYYDKPCLDLVAIDAGESHRARISAESGIEKRHPLVCLGIDRRGCEAIIEDHGLPIPIKSGCYICPMQRREQWVELNRRHPDLWCKAMTLENASVDSQIGKRAEPFYINDRPLMEVIRAKDGRGRRVNDDQQDLFDDRRPCQCGL